MTETPAPLRVRFVDEAKTTLAMDWPDGHVSTFPLWYLRGWCPCAQCQGHSGAHGYVSHSATRLTAIQPVGRYALALAFDDGHATGIYAFEWLRANCPCPACGGPREGTPGTSDSGP